MTRLNRWLWIVAITFGIGAPASAQRPGACEPRRPRGAVPFDLKHLDSLVGKFDLVLVRSIPKEWRDTTRGELELWRQDSANVYKEVFRRPPTDSVGRSMMARYLGGAFEVQHADTNYWWRRLAVRDRAYPGVEWYFGKLRFGDRDVLDGGGDDLTVEWVAPHEFGGRWRRDLGIAIIIAPDGRPYPNSEGHFCARRAG
jgi:hypothetical protein